MKSLVIAGGGVVGIAIARRAAKQGMNVFLTEQNLALGMETSSRNSEVIHAGIYYPKDSWKADLCVRGRRMLYDFCKVYEVPHARCGKVIVAQEHQTNQLRELAYKGNENGVEGLRLLSKAELQEMEPHVDGQEALYSPNTGIVDSHILMQTLQSDAEEHGAMIALGTTVESGVYNDETSSFELQVRQDGTADTIQCDYFVNATGIFAPDLARKVVHKGMKLPDKYPVVPSQLAKGTYFKLKPSLRPFSHLVYPLPEIGGLGVHATLDLEGAVRFGPDVEWVDKVDYRPDEGKASIFAERIRQYWRGIKEEDLTVDYCGIRPKIEMDGDMYHDFYIADRRKHQVPGLVHLCGVESPGLTSSLAIADTVVDKLLK